MSIRRVSLSHLGIHLSGVAFLGIVAWCIGTNSEAVKTAIVVIVVLGAIGWAVFGAIWWMIGPAIRKRLVSRMLRADPGNAKGGRSENITVPPDRE